MSEEREEEWRDRTLHECAAEGDTHTLGMLLHAGADVRARTRDGKWNHGTAVHVAADAGQVEALDYLLDRAGAHGARILGEVLASVDASGRTPLQTAAASRQRKAYEALRAATRRIEAAQRKTRTADEVSRAKEDALRFPLQAIERNDMESLHDWLQLGSVSVWHVDVERVAFREAKMNAATLLHLAAGAGHPEATQMLLNEGADLFAEDACGETAEDYARSAFARLQQKLGAGASFVCPEHVEPEQREDWASRLHTLDLIDREVAKHEVADAYPPLGLAANARPAEESSMEAPSP